MCASVCMCSCENTHAGAHIINLLWCFGCIFVVEAHCLCVLEHCCCLWVESLNGKAAVCLRKPCDSTMYMAQLSLPRALFELTHMWFVYSHLTAADSNIRLCYVVYRFVFMTQLLFRDKWSSSYWYLKVMWSVLYICLCSEANRQGHSTLQWSEVVHSLRGTQCAGWSSLKLQSIHPFIGVLVLPPIKGLSQA